MNRTKKALSINTIGIIQPWGVGDILMTVPVIAELRKLFPAAHIVLMVRGAPQAALLEGSTLINEILNIPQDRINILSFFKSLKTYNFDVVFIASRVTPIVPLLLRIFSGVRTIIGDGDKFAFLYTIFTKISDKKHRTQRMLETLAKWTGSPPPAPNFDLPIAEAAKSTAKARLLRVGLDGTIFVAIHPGSSRGIGEIKRLPVELVRSIVNLLANEYPHVRPAILLGPDDADMLLCIQGIGTKTTILTDCSLDETKYILSKAVGFIGSDSSLGHIATALTVPSIIGFGPSDPIETGPFGAKVKIIVTEETLPCRPCWYTPIKGKCPYSLRCMTSISADTVLEAVRSWGIPEE